MAAWRPDVLGPEFEQRTLALPDDDEGAVAATLVRRRRAITEPRTRFDVLYVHGWSDYFFQTELADFWAAQGGRFHALDLRKYGRSLRPHQTPGFVADLRTYDEDLEAALAAITTDPARPLVLMGHSTGGLTLALWVARNPGRCAALVLNSPWLELQTGPVGRAVIEPAVVIGAQLRPRRELPNLDLGFYARAVSARYDGEWAYEPDWRPERGFRTTRAWLQAVVRGQAQVAKGLHIDVPVLVLLSARSTLAPRWSREMLRSDTAIDVVAVARRLPDLGSCTTLVRLDGALHDVVLSARPVRERAYAEMARWLEAYGPLTRRPRVRRPGLLRALRDPVAEP